MKGVNGTIFMMVDEKITIEKYNSAWSAQFNSEFTLLLSILYNARGIEHIGSTAVNGMIAKPIIDILIGKDEVSLSDDEFNALKKLDYEYLGEAGVPGRIHLRKRKEYNFNLSIVKFESPLWENNIKFRNYLRENKNYAKKYAEHKLKIYNEGCHYLLEYSKAKAQMINMILEKL